MTNFGVMSKAMAHLIQNSLLYALIKFQGYATTEAELQKLNYRSKALM